MKKHQLMFMLIALICLTSICTKKSHLKGHKKQEALQTASNNLFRMPLNRIAHSTERKSEIFNFVKE